MVQLSKVIFATLAASGALLGMYMTVFDTMLDYAWVSPLIGFVGIGGLLFILIKIEGF